MHVCVMSTESVMSTELILDINTVHELIVKIYHQQVTVNPCGDLTAVEPLPFLHDSIGVRTRGGEHMN